jgi:steroid delta-isomerase-like uncharacterized protein
MTSSRSLAGLSVEERLALFEAACNAETLDDYAALLAPDLQVHNGNTTATGRDVAVRILGATKHAFPDFTMTVTRAVISGDEVAAELIERGTHRRDLVLGERTIPATGRSIELYTATFLRYGEDGLIRSVRDYLDRAAFREQLGL